MGDLNAVSVPIYMIRAVVNALRILGSVPPARHDLRNTFKSACDLAASLDRLSAQQTFPRGESIAAQGALPKAEARSWRGVARVEAFKAVFEKEIMPAFKALDDDCKGQARFHLVLTSAEG